MSTNPGLEEILASDWRKAWMFYTRFEITEEMFRRGVPAGIAAGGPHRDAV